jgi:hypothetical protein
MLALKFYPITLFWGLSLSRTGPFLLLKLYFIIISSFTFSQVPHLVSSAEKKIFTRTWTQANFSELWPLFLYSCRRSKLHVSSRLYYIF